MSRRKRRRSRLSVLVALGVAALPQAALAGAWTLEAGDAQFIVTGSLSRGDESFDGDGDRQGGSRYDKAEINALLEYGATDWLTLLLKPGLEAVRIEGPTEADRFGLGYSELGGRVRLADGESWVASAQSTLLVPGGFDETDPALAGHTDPEFDVRGLVGYGRTVNGWPAFMDVQLAQRFRFSDPPDEFRIDVTLGARPRPAWLLLAQSFNVVSEGSGGADFPSYRYNKLQLSTIHDLTSSLSVQLGGVTTYAGENALQENGLLLGLWYRF